MYNAYKFTWRNTNTGELENDIIVAFDTQDIFAQMYTLTLDGLDEEFVSLERIDSHQVPMFYSTQLFARLEEENKEFDDESDEITEEVE